MAKIRISTLAFFLVAGVTVFSLQHHAYAASCDAIVGKWSWFTGGVVTINPDGTMTHEPGNDGTWECTDVSRGIFTLRWRIGGYVNSLALSADGQGLSGTDQSQSYVTARRIGAGVKPDAKTHFNKGIDYHSKGMYDEAISEFSKAIEISPSYQEAFYNRALAYHDLEEYEKSLSDLTKAIELNPNYAKAYDLRADIHDHLADYEDALKDLEKAQELGYKVDQQFLDKLHKAAQDSKQPMQQATPEDSREMERLVERISQSYKGTMQFQWSGGFFDDDFIIKARSVSLEEDFILVEDYLECSITSPNWRFGDDNHIPADYKMSTESVEDCDKNNHGLKWEEKAERVSLLQINPPSIKVSEIGKGDGGSNLGISFGNEDDPFAISTIGCKNRSTCEQMASDLKKLVEIARKYGAGKNE